MERKFTLLLFSAVATSVISLSAVAGIATGIIPTPSGNIIIGATGAPGQCGVPGVAGADGQCGADGATGPCGPTGPAGETGATGTTGERGEAGQTGATGEQGEQGEQGEKGEAGATGATGATGPAGITTFGHWGSFWDTGIQPNPTAQPRAARLDSSDPDNCGVYLEQGPAGGSRIYVTRSGAYNLQFSAQIKTTQNNSYPIDIWLSKNGVPVADTNTQFFTPDRKGIIVAAWNFVIAMQAGDYVELMWYSKDTNLYLSNLAPQDLNQATPSVDYVIPAVPSLILTLTQVGELPSATPSPTPSSSPTNSPTPSPSPSATTE